MTSKELFLKNRRSTMFDVKFAVINHIVTFYVSTSIYVL